MIVVDRVVLCVIVVGVDAVVHVYACVTVVLVNGILPLSELLLVLLLMSLVLLILMFYCLRLKCR